MFWEGSLDEWHLLLKITSRITVKINEGEGPTLAVSCTHAISAEGLLMVGLPSLQVNERHSYSWVGAVYRVHFLSPLSSLLWKSQ